MPLLTDASSGSPQVLFFLAHRFVVAPRNTERIPSSPRFALGQKPGDLRDPDDASVNKAQQDLHPDALRRDGRHVIRFQVAFRAETWLRWVSDWKRKAPSENDFLEAHSPAGSSPWLAMGERDVAPVDAIVQDLWWMRRDTVVSQEYTIGDVYPRAADERPH
jgi:hypothetical protein